MKISRTPLRISFFGGGSDYRQYYLEHEGAILGTSVSHFVYVCLHNGEISHFFDLPTKSGLASSSAYTIGLLRACSFATPKEIAKMATTLEVEKTGGNVGSQDQYLCAVGGFHHLKFSEHGIRDIPLSPELVKPLEKYLMLFDTHQYRKNGDIIPQQLREMTEHEDIYKRMVDMVDEGVKIIKSQDWLGFGSLLDEAWQLKRQLSKTISTPIIDSIYDSAVKAGAIGGKLLGGGGGGFILFLVEPNKQEQVRQVLGELTYTPFEFETEGTRLIYED